MVFEFTKMHGLGNDYVYVDVIRQKLEADWSALARAVSDRHFGIGGDGLILLAPSKRAPVKMRIFNADGSEAEMCGNGLRCTAKYAYEHGMLVDAVTSLPERFETVIRQAGLPADTWQAAALETGAGVLEVAIHVDANNRVDLVCVDMGEPVLDPKAIPVDLPGETIVRQSLDLPDETVHVTCVSMGNPHAVVFTDRIDGVDLDRLGPLIERHKRFAHRTNVHFACASGRDHVDIVTWERGSGQTLACGTGAAAVCVAGVLEERTERSIAALLPGGRLIVFWSGDDQHVYTTGPAEEVFTGTWLGS